MLGICDETVIFNRLTQAVRMLARKARWNSTLNEIDICVCDGCVTLPAECKTILGVAVNGAPSFLQDSWISYHLNGPGTNTCYPTSDYTRIVGTFCTIKDPSSPVYLAAALDSAADNNKILRVYGWTSNGTRIFTPNPLTGQMEDGILVPTVYGFTSTNPSAPAIQRIDRVQKDPTVGFVRLLAINPADLSLNTVLGIYQPNEVNPQYVRLKVPRCACVRVKYQKHDDIIRSQEDWVNIADEQSILMALKAVRFRLEDKFADADAAEATAGRLLSEEQKSLQPNSVLAPQVINQDIFNDARQENQMFYGSTGSFSGLNL